MEDSGNNSVIADKGLREWRQGVQSSDAGCFYGSSQDVHVDPVCNY
jgi:hypothetical protein